LAPSPCSARWCWCSRSFAAPGRCCSASWRSAREAGDGHARLRRVIAGVALGLGTTLIGYLTFLLTPFPLLQQISAFSACGLIGSCLTVALFYPELDRGGPVRHGTRLVTLAGGHWAFWQSPRWRVPRWLALLLCLGLGIAGLGVLQVDDDIRHMQSLSPALKIEEQRIQSLTGSGAGTQFLLIDGADEEALLETEERLAPTLAEAERDGLLAGAQTVAQFVPSLARQRDNRRLVQEALYGPYLADYRGQLGFTGTIDPGMDAPFLVPAALPRQGPLALAASLILEDGGRLRHLALLQGVGDSEALRARIRDPNVRLVSPAEDYSRLFAKYRERAVVLLALSAVLMLPMLVWRYGWLDALRVMAPSLAALLLAPPIAALFGVRFTFFNAIALVLVLSIGVDYAVFCRETAGARKPVTMLAVALAALCTILSFGLLALSRVFAVSSFGVTMLIGIALAFLLAPAAGDGEARAARQRRA
jgi:predicted exporter